VRHPWLAVPPHEVERVTASDANAVDGAPGSTHLTRVLYADTMSLNLYDVLGIGDRNSMAHSVESRVPFVDHVLIEFAFSLPDEMKIGDGWRKRILRHLVADYVPPQVAFRSEKMGFAIPQGTWMREHFADDLRALPDREVIAASPLFARDALRAIVTRFLDEGDDARAGDLWRIMASARWAEIWGVSLQ
jgi:asparagine synthase (glutamine-hydrolysing)